MISSMPDLSDLGKARWPERSWLTIWTKPRGTVRAIIDADPTRHLWKLAILAGIYRAFDRIYGSEIADSSSLGLILLFSLLGGLIAGPLAIVFAGFIFRVVGRMLGGQATDSEDTRAAVAWASIPSIAALLPILIGILLYGKEMFTIVTPRIDANPLSYILIVAAEIIFNFWAFFLLVKCIAEAHRFSAWRGLLTVILPTLVIVVPLVICLFTAGLLSGLQ